MSNDSGWWNKKTENFDRDGKLSTNETGTCLVTGKMKVQRRGVFREELGTFEACLGKDVQD